MVSFLNYTAFLLINLLKLLLGLLKGLLIVILWSSHNWTGQLFAISLYQPAKGHLPFGTWSSITMSHSPSLDSLLNWDINPMRMSEHLLIPCEIPCYIQRNLTSEIPKTHPSFSRFWSWYHGKNMPWGWFPLVTIIPCWPCNFRSDISHFFDTKAFSFPIEPISNNLDDNLGYQRTNSPIPSHEIPVGWSVSQ